MTREITQAVRFTLVTMALFGGAYPAVLWAVGRVAFPAQAEGSLVRRPDGTTLGSRLIAQPSVQPQYFQPRPSAVEYDGAAAGATNFGPSNAEHLKAVRSRLKAIRTREENDLQRIPSEMVTASASGLDPHITPAAAQRQAARIARTRGVAVDRVRGLIKVHTEPPALGFLGRSRVNVLELNLALDAMLPAAGARPHPPRDDPR